MDQPNARAQSIFQNRWVKVGTGILVAIVILVVFASQEDEDEPPKEWPVVTLRCGEEYDYHREISKAGGGKIVVPVAGCETGKVLLPTNFRVGISPDLPIEIRRYYESNPPDGEPYVSRPEAVVRPKDTVTAVRFTNTGKLNGNREVTVWILPY